MIPIRAPTGRGTTVQVNQLRVQMARTAWDRFKTDDSSFSLCWPEELRGGKKGVGEGQRNRETVKKGSLSGSVGGERLANQVMSGNKWGL